MNGVIASKMTCFVIAIFLIIKANQGYTEQKNCNPDTGKSCLPEVLKGKTIRFCSDSSEWPPFTYFKRNANSEKLEDQVIGFNVELVDHIFKDLDIGYQFSLVPWKRCMQQGLVNGAFDVVLDASFNTDRVEKYLMSISHYSLNLSYFYSNEKYPGGLKYSSLDDLKRDGGVCGLSGYSYTALGDYNEKVDKGAINFHALVQRTQKDRCNVFIARQEIFDGLLMLDTKLAELSESISSNKIPNIDQEKFYMLISRKFPNPYELKYVLDSGVQQLKASGYYDKLLIKYIGG